MSDSPLQPIQRPRVALVIDDEEQLIRLILRVLERSGFEVHCAMTAKAGLEIFRTHSDSIDVTLLDVQLPDMGAPELLPLLLAERPGLRLILTSGEDLPPALEQEMNSIAGRFLRKPFVPKALLRILDDVLSGSPETAGDTASVPSDRARGNA